MIKIVQLTVLLFCINLALSLSVLKTSSGRGQRNGTTTTRTDVKKIPNPRNKYEDRMDGGPPRLVSEYEVEDTPTSTIIGNTDKRNKETKNGYITIQLWPDKTLVYEMDSSIDKKIKTNILSAMQMISSQTCIKFKRKSRRDTYWATFSVNILDPLIYPEIGWQNIKNQLINVAVANRLYGNYYIGVVLHAILHALGFLDEQNRNDRDEYVAVQFDNLILDRRFHFLKDRHTGLSKTHHYSVPYNYESIMHSTSDRFAINKSKDTVTPIKNPNAMGNVQNMGQRDKLSVGDLMTINNKYQCGGQTQMRPPHSTARYNGET